ncbi:ribonuclease E/G [Alkalicoccus urumqiensis]|uniref:S1 motif domain-containing protein n=1 Tax=Alkalicoccus urumqiensis TaxID=1548213 RepID=A0A2P6MF27_ALKUR|nr:ribonuclease E/G [Alkalicoccus urumqiensis]PRO64886.1 hypothetical protein C6I21_12120 [Alkalicoccus urumqiensis]
MDEVYVEKTVSGHRGALLENGRVEEWFLEEENTLQKGTILRGKIKKLLPSLDAAFVDIGEGKEGYLAKKEHPRYQQWKLNQEGKEPSVTALLQQGETVIVQVKREAASNKGPQLTMILSIPGERLVLEPFSDYAAVSKKLSDPERDRLRQEAELWRRSPEGIIVRTAADGISAEDFRKEADRLRRKWADIKAAEGRVLYREGGVLPRLERDILLQGKKQIKTNDAALASVWKDQFPDCDVEWSRERALFYSSGLQKELHQSTEPFVWLKRGGSIMVEETETMTVIDVNSSKQIRGSGSLQATALKVNKEAAEEAARQLRLRDIGGMIIVDFIRMKATADREELLRVFKKALSRDRTHTYVTGYSGLGFVELTRKQSRKPLREQLTVPCPVCSGAGRVRKPSETALEIASFLPSVEAGAALVETSPETAAVCRTLSHPGGAEVYFRETERMEGFRLLRMGPEAVSDGQKPWKSD